MAKAGKSGTGKPGTRRPVKNKTAQRTAAKGGSTAKKAAGLKKASPRKTAAKKTPTPPRTRKGRERTAARIIPHTATTLLVLIGFLVMAAAGAYVLLYPEISETPLGPASSPSRPASPVTTKTSKTTKPHYEVFPKEPAPTWTEASPVHRQPVATGKPLPRVAIIIDDIGHDRKMAEKFFTLNTPLTYAILPHSRFCREIAVLAARKGYEVMLHLPMEPNEYPLVDPGPGVLLAAMTPDERIDQLKRNLAAVPHVRGVNNHMGSKMTTLSDEMNQVFGILKQRRLFFVDSRTTAATQTRSSAKLFKVPYAERDVFLDHVQKRDAIRRQIDQLVNIAEIHGKAVAIGHPYHVTYEVLAEALSDLKERVKLVSASEIVEVF